MAAGQAAERVRLVGQDLLQLALRGLLGWDGGVGASQETEPRSVHVCTCAWTSACDRHRHRLPPTQTPNRASDPHQGMEAESSHACHGALLVGSQSSSSRMALDRWATCLPVSWSPGSPALPRTLVFLSCAVSSPPSPHGAWCCVGRNGWWVLSFSSWLFRKDGKRCWVKQRDRDLGPARGPRHTLPARNVRLSLQGEAVSPQDSSVGPGPYIGPLCGSD